MLRRQRAGEEGRMPVPEVGGELEVFFHQTVTKRPFKGGCPAREVACEYRETIVVGGFAMRKTSSFVVSFLALGLLALSSAVPAPAAAQDRSEEHTSELQSLMRISYAVFCLKKKKVKHEYKPYILQ